MKQFRVFLASLLCAIFGTSAFAGVGSHDARQNANWSDDKFARYVAMGERGKCTGQYVAPNLILTAAHCYPGASGKIGSTDHVVNSANEKFWVEVVANGGYITDSKDSRLKKMEEILKTQIIPVTEIMLY